MDFYLNDQLSAEEKEDLREGGMPDFIINRITPAIDIMKFLLQLIILDGSYRCRRG